MTTAENAGEILGYLRYAQQHPSYGDTEYCLQECAKRLSSSDQTAIIETIVPRSQWSPTLSNAVANDPVKDIAEALLEQYCQQPSTISSV